MPDFCAARGCSNERSLQTKTRGITFHKFPKNKERRRQWELALRRDGFVASNRSLLCSEHFRSEDFDSTGQTVRLKAGTVPQIFNFPAHLLKTRSDARRGNKTMPDFCAAYGCSNEQSTETRSRGITFHRFPKDNSLKRQWELAVKHKGFVAAERSLLCSEHFKPDDFDRTGQIVKLRHGVKPSIFNFPSHLQKQEPSRTTKASRKGEESLPMDSPQHFPEAEPHSNVDHNYALPASPAVLKARLGEALARVESLERERRNSMLRERRAKKNVQALLEDLREKNLINEELKDRLDCYSDLRLDVLAMKGHEYTREQKEFALTLYLHGPKAYSFLRESHHLPLPHPHTLQRWLTSVDA